MSLLDAWHTYCQDLEAPDLFIDATFYTMISAALQRNICYEVQPHMATHGGIFSNIYVVFIGPSRIGKSSAANPAKALYKSFTGYTKAEDATGGKINLAPDSITLAQLYKYMELKFKIKTLPASGGPAQVYFSSPLAFFATEELENLLKKDDDDIVPFLTEGWNCGDFHRETKGQGINFIKNMCVTLLGCATADWIKVASSSGILRRGFAARTVFIFADKRRKRTLVYKFDRPEQLVAWNSIKDYISKLVNLYGAAIPSPEASAWLREWYVGGGDNPVNKDHRCQHYYDNKKLHLIKMAMVVHFSRSLDYTITVEDFKDALQFLSRCEVDMHRALMGSGQNVAYDAAMAIEGIMHTEEDRWWPAPTLLARVFGDHCRTREDFDAAIQYLTELRIVRGEPIDGRMNYKLRKEGQ
mgnify:CR=1 FL=1